MRTLRGILAVSAIALPSLVPLAGVHPAAATPPLPRLAVGDVKVAEGDSGKTVVKVPIDLDVPSSAKFYVYWKLSGGSATPGVDFLAPKAGYKLGKSGIGAKKTEALVSVTILGDPGFEPDETINLDVTATSGATVARGHGTVTIINDDSPATSRAATADASTPRLSIGTPAIAEGNAGTRHAPVPITLSIPAPDPVTVTFETPGTDASDQFANCDDPSQATVDNVTTTLTFARGQQSKYVKVPVLGNTSVDAALRDIADTVAIVSGSATLAEPTSDIVLMDDDGGRVAVEPPVGTLRVSEPVTGEDPTFPPVISRLVGCGYPQSTFSSVSSDGRYVAFSSNADNLVGNDTNAANDVFVKDTWTGEIERVSVAADGTQGDGASDAVVISADGRYVLFNSIADNLVPGQTRGQRDGFLEDRLTGAVTLLGSESVAGSISADDRYVVFRSGATLTGGCSTCTGIFMLDRDTDTVSLVSTDTYGTQLAWAYLPVISGDGHHVVFNGPDILGRTTMFVKDLDTGKLETVSVNNAGQVGAGTFGTMPFAPAVSYDGQTIAFDGQYCNMGLASSRCGNSTDYYGVEVWVRDRVAGTTTLASLDTDGTPISDDSSAPSLSSDGTRVLFQTADVSFATGCSDSEVGGDHMYERDLATGVTTRVDVLSASVPCPPESINVIAAAMSADGSVVTYSSMVELGDVSASNPETVFVTRLG